MKRFGTILALAAMALALQACSTSSTPEIVYVEVTAVPTFTPAPTPTPEGIPGLTEPITVRGVKMQFTGVALMESVVLNGRTSRAGAPYNTLVVVDATFSPYSNAPCEWQGEDQVNLSWTRNGEAGDNDWGICQTLSSGTVRFFFAAFKDSDNLTLTLPGGILIPLDLPRSDVQGQEG